MSNMPFFLMLGHYYKMTNIHHVNVHCAILYNFLSPTVQRFGIPVISSFFCIKIWLCIVMGRLHVGDPCAMATNWPRQHLCQTSDNDMMANGLGILVVTRSSLYTPFGMEAKMRVLVILCLFKVLAS